MFLGSFEGIFEEYPLVIFDRTGCNRFSNRRFSIRNVCNRNWKKNWTTVRTGDTTGISAVTVAPNFVDYFSILLLKCTLVGLKNQ
jgi:hypothetical protein